MLQRKTKITVIKCTIIDSSVQKKMDFEHAKLKSYNASTFLFDNVSMS